MRPMNEKINSFMIPGRLPSLNDYQNACRSHWSTGARMKRNVEEGIIWAIKAARSRGDVRPAMGPVVVSFEWHESNKRRDLDNIYSAKKFILDAMQKAGIIKSDSPAHVVGLHDTPPVYDTEDFVIVTIQEAEWRK